MPHTVDRDELSTSDSLRSRTPTAHIDQRIRRAMNDKRRRADRPQSRRPVSRRQDRQQLATNAERIIATVIHQRRALPQVCLVKLEAR